MDHARAISPTAERLTWSEIRARYPDEYLSLAEIEWAEGDEIVSARVAAHARGFRAVMTEPCELLVFPLTGRGGPRRPRMIIDDDSREPIHHRR